MRDLVFIDNLPVSILIRVEGYTFELLTNADLLETKKIEAMYYLCKRMWEMNMYQYRRCTAPQRTVNPISMPCNPTDIGSTKVNITRMIIERIFESCRCKDHKSCGSMKKTLWFSGRAAIYDREMKNKQG